MTRIFIGGSRRITRLEVDVRRRLDRIVEKGLPVVIGDANGADKSVQRYLSEQKFEKVEVYCADESPRNNVGGWPVRVVRRGHARKGRASSIYGRTATSRLFSPSSIARRLHADAAAEGLGQGVADQPTLGF